MTYILEQTSQGDIGKETATVNWRIRGTVPATATDPFDQVAQFVMTPNRIPRTFSHPRGTLYLQDIQIHENHAARSYSITAPYGITKRDPGAYQLVVDQTGGTVNVTAGTRIAGYGPFADEVDNGGLIGVDGDEIRGVDIPVAESKITVNFRHPEGKLNAAYVKAVGQLVGYPNSTTFLTYAPGEVLYLGSNFAETDMEATAQYSFAISYNVQNLILGGITVAFKAGWDVLNISYKDEVDNGHNVKRIKYIEVIRPAGREWINYMAAFGWG